MKSAPETPKPMNTRISYLYRDDGNYKTYYSQIVKGMMTKDQENRLRATLVDDDNFCGEQVGLLLHPDDDVKYTMTSMYELEAIEPVNEKPTLDITCEELVQRFESVKNWDYYAGMDPDSIPIYAFMI